MEIVNNACSLKLFVLSSLFYITSGQHDQGYLYSNSSSVPYCVSPPDSVCAVNHKVVKIESHPTLIQSVLQSINLTLQVLNYYQGVNSSCRESLREFMCSNSIQICDEENGTMRYDVQRSERACARAKASCPKDVQAWAVQNCSHIMRLSVPLPRCVRLPDANNGFCPKRTYKVLQQTADIYQNITKAIASVFPLAKLFMSSSCFEKYVSVTCYLTGGPICSDNGRILLHVISRQDCLRFKQECISIFISSSLDCSVLPDNANAQKVPLPSGVNAGSILQTRGSTNKPRHWSTNKPTNWLKNGSTKRSTNG